MLLILCLFVFGTLEPIRLDINSKHYVTLLVGTPGTRIRFFLNLTHNDIHISKSLYDRSQSFFASLDGTSGSESFYLGDHRIRFPVKFTALEKDNIFTIFQHQFDGVLGLGPLSPIWIYWNRATITPRKLYLGELRLSSLLNADEHPPVLPYIDVWHGYGPVVIHPYSVFSFIPEEDFRSEKKCKIFGNSDLCNLIFDGSCLSEKSLQFGRISLIGARGMTFDPVSIGNDRIKLGLEFFESHVVLIDRIQNVVAISESVFSFRDYSYPCWFSILIVAIVLPYALIETEHSTVIRELELYGLITLAIAYVDLIFGLLVSRHIRDFCEINDAWPFLIYILIHIVALAAKILVNRIAL